MKKWRSACMLRAIFVGGLPLFLFSTPFFAHAAASYSGTVHSSVIYPSPTPSVQCTSSTMADYGSGGGQWSCSAGGAASSVSDQSQTFTGTITYNGTQKTFSLSCGPGKYDGSSQCTQTTSVTAGVETFTVTLFAIAARQGESSTASGYIVPASCSAGYGLSGSDCIAAPSCTLSGPTSITNGNSATLTWSATNSPTSFSINQNIGGVTPASGGSVTVSPAVTTTYTGTATNVAGSATCTKTITVNPAPAPTCTLSASPASITSGGSSQLSWTTTNASSFSVNQGIGTVTPTVSGYRIVSPAANTTYTGTVTGTGGTASCTAAVSISANPPPTVDLVAYPTTVSSGGSSMLTWSSNYATSCTGTGFSTGGATSNSSGVSTGALTSNKTYSISCTGSGGTANDSVTVSIAANPPPTVTLTASPSTIQSGETSTLSWTSSNATSCVNTTSNWKATTLSGSTTTPPLSAGQTYTIRCSNANGTQDATAVVTVSAGKPDLIISDITPTVVGFNTLTSFSATVKNQGAGDAGSFSDRLTYYSDPNCTARLGYFGTVSNASLGAGKTHTDIPTPKTALPYSYVYGQATADYLNDVPESDENNNLGLCTKIYIGTAKPELRQDTAIWPTKILVNTPTTFQANIRNTSFTNSTGQGFYVLFQRANDAAGNGVTDIATYHTNSSLSANSPLTATMQTPLTYSTTTPGYFYMRACADKSSATNTGVISEADETNNCGLATEPLGGTLITVGQNAVCGTTHWSCTAGDAGTESTTVGGDGTTTYLWSCKDQYGVGTTASCSEIVPPPPTITFNNNGPVNRGGVARLTWSSTNATSCTGTGFSTGGATSNATGVSTGALYTNTSYLITCTGPGGTRGPQGTTVTVIQPKVQIYADPSRVRSGGTVTVTWSATGVNSCSIGGPNMTTSNTFSAATSTQSNVSVTSQSTYTITCTEADGTTQDVKSATVNVVPTFQTF